MVDVPIRRHLDHLSCFSSATGEPIEPNTFRRCFYRLCDRHGVRRIRIHDLRHSQATLLKKLGVDPKDAQLILSHASVRTTQEIYQHGDDESQQKALQQVERVYLRAVDGNGCRQTQPSKSLMWEQLQRLISGEPNDETGRNPLR